MWGSEMEGRKRKRDIWAFPVIALALTIVAVAVMVGALSVSAGTDTAPNSPSLVSPTDWAVFIGEMPELCAADNDDPDGDAITGYRFIIFDSARNWDSGWVSDSCAQPPDLGYYGFQWHAKVRDATGDESDWSPTWHFNVESPVVTFSDIHFNPPSPSDAEQVKTYACTQGHAGVGIGLRVSVNEATDGSDDGKWDTLAELGVPCFSDADVPVWNTLGYADGRHLVKFQARRTEDNSWEEATKELRVYELLRRQPSDPVLVVPSDGADISAQRVTFAWLPSLRTITYTLVIGDRDPPELSIRQMVKLPADVLTYTVGFTQSVDALYWRVFAGNEKGESGSGVRSFHLQVPPKVVHTLILTNSSRWPGASEEDLKRMRDSLASLSDDDQVDGVVLDLAGVPEVQAAYVTWDAEPLDPEAANGVVATIRKEVLTSAQGYPELRYVVLVGPDYVIPYVRRPDGTTLNESNYVPIQTGDRTLAALAAGYYLSDSPYGDLTPEPGGAVMPELSVGRLVETPGDITATVSRFLGSRGVIPQRALVTGYDFMEDGAQAYALTLSQEGIAPETSLVGDGWSLDDLKRKLYEGGYDILSLNQHANAVAMGVPEGTSRLGTADFLAHAPSMDGVLAGGIGCHAGLNLAGVTDWPQVFEKKGAVYYGHTGYSWGLRQEIGYSELLQRLLGEGLKKPGMTAGDALRLAIRRYRQQSAFLDAYDRKVLEEMAFYGLPMTPVGPEAVSATAHTAGRSGAFSADERAAASGGPVVTSVTVTPTFSLARGPDGDFYYVYDPGGVEAHSGYPIQPKLPPDLAVGFGVGYRGVALIDAAYEDVPDFDAAVGRADSQGLSDPTILYLSGVWFPGRLVVFHPAEQPGEMAKPVLVMGQYLASARVQRLYHGMHLEVYGSGSDDREPPTVGDVHAISGGGAISVTAYITDTSGIYQAMATYTDQKGTWRSVPMHKANDTSVWEGVIPVGDRVQFVVQAVDGAGNVAWEDNGGLYYSAGGEPAAGGLHCGGTGPVPGPADACGCVWGVVRANGVSRDGVSVSVSYGEKTLSLRTALHMEDPYPEEPFPYYGFDADVLGAHAGDTVTVTVEYLGAREIAHVVMPSLSQGEQRADFDFYRVYLPVVRK